MSADIDLDFADRESVLKPIQHVPAMHECAVIDYQTAKSRGHFKIDFLNMHVYKLVQIAAALCDVE